MARSRNAKKKSDNGENEENNHGQRGLWRGNISFGLVNIAVKLVSAKEMKSLSFNMLDPSNLAPVGYKYYNKASGE